MSKKLNGDQLLKIIAFAIEQNKILINSPTMPDAAFPYYMEGKLVGYGLAIRNEKDRHRQQEQIAEMLAIVMKLKEQREKAPKPTSAKPAPAKTPAKVIQ